MRKGLTLLMYATLPCAAGFMLSGAAAAQGLQYEAPTAAGTSVPVTGAYPSAPVPVGDMTRSAQMEAQIRELTNQLEQRDYQIRQLQQSFEKYKADSEARLQALESGLSGTITGTGSRMNEDEQAYAPPSPAPVQNDAAVAHGGGESGAVSGTLTDPNGVFQPSSTPRLGQIMEPSANADNGGAITSGRPQGAGTISAAQAYDQAFAYLQKSNYSDAQRAFADFLRTYPTHPLAANAQYWLGETYFAQTQYSLAAKTFARAFQDHPQGQKAPDALLKLALTLEKMNKKDDACLTLGELAKRFPSGPASVLRRGTEEGQRMGCPGQG